jgi:hypothetical protein
LFHSLCSSIVASSIVAMADGGRSRPKRERSKPIDLYEQAVQEEQARPKGSRGGGDAETRPGTRAARAVLEGSLASTLGSQRELALVQAAAEVSQFKRGDGTGEKADFRPHPPNVVRSTPDWRHALPLP